MKHLLLTLPVLIPLMTAAVLFFLRKHNKLISSLSILSTLINLCVALCLVIFVTTQGIQSVSFGNWKAPFGIVFVADLLTTFMVMVTTIIGFVIVMYGVVDLKNKPSYSLYHVQFHSLLAGVCGAFLTGDIFNLYVWFEVILISSFGLMILNGSKAQIDGAVKYVILNLISTLVFLLGIGLLYGATGTLNMADLHLKIQNLNPEISTRLASLFIFAFAIKSALFPVFSWLPASYHTMPSAVVALFAALLTKVGVYAFIRVFTLIFRLDHVDWQTLLIWISGLTMLTGVLGAAYQTSIKKILSFHIISQIGYIMMGLALFTPLAIAGAIFYTIHHIIVKANLFLIGGVLSKSAHSDVLSNLGGVYKSRPILSFLFLIPAFSLAGFPPLSGFWGKFMVIKASLQTEYFYLALTALFVGLLTIFSMTKIWSQAFWKPAPVNDNQSQVTQTSKERFLYYCPIMILSVLTVAIGFSVQPLFNLSLEAASQLLNPADYVEAVLKEAP